MAASKADRRNATAGPFCKLGTFVSAFNSTIKNNGVIF